MKLLLNYFQVGSKKEMNISKQLRNRHKITDILILFPGFFVKKKNSPTTKTNEKCFPSNKN